ncbi:MAG: hypothetical protein KDD04_11065, partial [Sinomicrobium sp.]|nr:hypothetical protein [Sinomicrobium sp.]
IKGRIKKLVQSLSVKLLNTTSGIKTCANCIIYGKKGTSKILVCSCSENTSQEQKPINCFHFN